VSDQNWRADAKCAGIDGELFFPISYTSTVGLNQVEAAKRVCTRCPVLAQCNAYIADFEGGTNADNRVGIYAGQTPKERHAAYRRATRSRETADVS
jgi:WhiB family redox-sensing transcriptional regulator